MRYSGFYAVSLVFAFFLGVSSLHADNQAATASEDIALNGNYSQETNTEESADESLQQPLSYPKQGFFKMVSGMFEMADTVPKQTETPLQFRRSESLIDEIIQEKPLTPGPVAILTSSEVSSRATTGLTEALTQSSTVGGVEMQRRSQVAMDPSIRGYKNTQIYAQADGASWVPARRDLDTMLSKFDPGMIRYATVLPGPYSVQYGPGLAFVDIEREPTPRNRSEYELDTAVRTNGGQVYGRATAASGGSNWGFRSSYGERDGSSYRAGSNILIPSGYHNRDLFADLSYDVNPYQHVDVSYMRLDQTDTLYPCQFFDVDAMSSYGFTARVVDEDPTAPWTKLTVEGWYNRTYFRGDTRQKSLQSSYYPTIGRIDFALDDFFGQPVGTNDLQGWTHGNQASSGTRMATMLGDKDDVHVNAGVDFRYQEQYIREDFTIYQFSSAFDSFYDNMPTSWAYNPGAFVDWTKPLSDNWTTTFGARVDAVATRARSSDLRLSGMTLNPDELPQSDTLYAFYLNNKWTVNENLNFTGSAGLGQRAPSLLERYSDGLFISSAQSGFTKIYGDPTLKPERDWQIDLGANLEYENFRSRAGVFQAWIVDYITYRDEFVIQFMDARRLHYINTNMATLTGFDWFGEIDVAPRWSTFAKMAYVQGQDQQIDQPLPSISPLDSMVGIRFHSPDKMRKWEIEFAARIVNTQNRLGAVHDEFAASGYTTIEQQTPGFAVWHISSYWNYTKNLRLVAGIDNLFDRTYQEHLDLRLSGPTGYPADTTRVLAPGFTPYFGVNWIF
jgi:outer membrane receptor protein involved in Fe transport